MWSKLLGSVTLLLVIIAENTPAIALSKPDDNPDIDLSTVSKKVEKLLYLQCGHNMMLHFYNFRCTRTSGILVFLGKEKWI